MPLIRALAPLLLCLAAPAAAQNCTASLDDIDFGEIALTGPAPSTGGTLRVGCTGGVAGSVGTCVRIGAGSGGASGGARLMQGASGSLAYALRRGVTGPVWTEEFIAVPIVLGTGTVDVDLRAEILSSGPSVGIGSYASSFAGGAARIDWPVSSCAQAAANSASLSFEIGATVTSSCEVSAGTLAFGTLSGMPVPAADATSAISVSCTAGTAYSILMGDGTGVGASGPTDRRMTGPLGQLRFGIYRDAARSLPWGDGPGEHVSGTGTGASQSISVHGRVPGGQSPPPGAYVDSVLVTIEY